MVRGKKEFHKMNQWLISKLDNEQMYAKRLSAAIKALKPAK
jgi:hypothetical protein